MQHIQTSGPSHFHASLTQSTDPEGLVNMAISADEEELRTFLANVLHDIGKYSDTRVAEMTTLFKIRFQQFCDSSWEVDELRSVLQNMYPAMGSILY